MNELTGFMSQKDEIARLNKQIDMIAGFYIKQVEATELELSKSKRVARYFKG